jgi:flagellar motor component MotA
LAKDVGDRRNRNRFSRGVGEYVLEQGNPLLLIQPAELLIVVGAAVGITIVANPVRVIRKIAYSARHALRAPTLTRTAPMPRAGCSA